MQELERESEFGLKTQTPGLIGSPGETLERRKLGGIHMFIRYCQAANSHSNIARAMLDWSSINERIISLFCALT